MRIIAGQRRGHRIDSPPGRDLRPTSDMVREAIFNILRDDVADRPVVDLFAGTGALGLEALSRGASRCLFVERNRSHAALIRRNLAALRYEDRGTVRVADAYPWVNSFRPDEGVPILVFLDPPYRDFEGRGAARMRRLVSDLVGRLPRGSMVVIESGARLGGDILPDPEGWDLRRYGDTRLAVREVGSEGMATDVVESASPDPPGGPSHSAGDASEHPGEKS